jgi:hypothetical protein
MRKTLVFSTPARLLFNRPKYTTMPDHRYMGAALAALALATILTMIVVAILSSCSPRRTSSGGEGYLVYPYLDLDTAGERGSYYAMSESSSCHE